jgi:hypothetical protein
MARKYFIMAHQKIKLSSLGSNGSENTSIAIMLHFIGLIVLTMEDQAFFSKIWKVQIKYILKI